MSIAFFWILILLMAFGTPVIFALLLGPGLSLLLDGELRYVPALLARFYNGIDSFPLLAVPFFILAGEIMNAGGITTSIVRFAQSLVGHVRGGLAQVNVLSSMIFAGISGSAVADASALGKMLIPAMEREGYPRPFASAVTAAAAVIGPVIPPSGIMVLYGFVMNVSVGALFAAGVVPGVIIGLGLMGTIRLLAKRYNLPAAKPRATWGERATAFRGAWLAMLLPVILLGGMLSGVFTATEAACVAVAYALFVTIFVTRNVRRRELFTIFKNTALQSGAILLLVGAAVTLGWLVTVSGLAKGIADAMLLITDDVSTLLFLVNVLLLIVGMFLDAGPAILILGPVLSPVFVGLGVDPVHFAIIMCVNLTIGLATPPMGLLLFVTASVAREKIENIVRALLPFLAVEILVIFVITYFPSLVLTLPRALGLM
ncbi:MAG: TRAP transporter large permease [Steroidobacteraceae bacterium]|jgi:tripartite ATP-independent transporter DctM subunit|nr:TRAP transporter large permease [Gammaproteobacteria bacterium]